MTAKKKFESAAANAGAHVQDLADNAKQVADDAKQAAHDVAHDAASAAANAAQHIKEHVADMLPSRAKEMLPSKAREVLPSKAQEVLPDAKSVAAFIALPSVAVMIAFFVVLFTVLFIFRRKWMPYAKKYFLFKRNRVVLICGPVDSGKTALFFTLSNGKFQSTQTSMEENVDTFHIHSKILNDAQKQHLSKFQFEFVDFPGRTHGGKMNKYLKRTQGVVFLIDASSNDSVVNGAKMLYSLLEMKDLMKRKIPILVCANKIDLNNVASMTVIRTKILEELNKLKESQPGNIEHGEEGAGVVGKPDEKLTAENIGTPISFGQISAKEGKLTDVLDFLESLPKRKH